MRKTKLLKFLLPCIAVALPIVLSEYLRPTQAQVSSNVHLCVGNPSNATTNVSFPNNYLLLKPQYVLSYSRDKGIPNWVSWQLNSSWLGSTPRQDNFRADTTLPSEWYQVAGSDYSGSGFDRGHMTPSGDRTSTVTDNSATFLMTNMVPQSPDNNQGPWASLENYSRSLVNEGNELCIISGTYGIGGTGSNGTKYTIANGNVQVPNRVWKVIIVNPGAEGFGVTTSTRVISVDMPNTQGIRNDDWRTYRVSVDSIEAQTGFDFLSNVSTSVQSVIESRVDNL